MSSASKPSSSAPKSPTPVASCKTPPPKKPIEEESEESEEEEDMDNTSTESDEDDGKMSKDSTDSDDDGKQEIEEDADDFVAAPAHFQTFEVLQPEKLVESRIAQIERVCGVLSLPSGTASLLLQHFGWDCNRLVEKYYSGDDIWAETKVANPNAAQPRVAADPEAEADCPVCMCPYPNKEMVAMQCGHSFCIICWSQHLKQKVMNENQSKLIECPQAGCHLLTDQMLVSRILKQTGETGLCTSSTLRYELRTEVYERYTRLIAEAFVEDSRDLRWCPAPGCKNAIRMMDPAPKPVRCTCGKVFCFMCGEVPHEPATCKMMKDWAKKLADDSETANFMAVYTKECPKCSVVIYKDEGCQYMRCPRCHHAFCWLCLGSFDHVDHKCNRYQSSGMDSKRAELHKFSHFFDRYSNHKRSRELEQKLISHANARITELLRERGGLRSHHEYVMEAAVQLQEARTILMTTYIYGYYLPPEVHRDLFEFLQADLEQAVERLSQVLEDKAKAWADRDKTVALMSVPGDAPHCALRERNVKQRIVNLIDGLEAGEIQGAVPSKEKIYYDPSKSTYQGWVYGKNLLEDDPEFRKQKEAEERRKKELADQMVQIAGKVKR